MKKLILPLLLLAVLHIQAQDCQLVSLSLPIPAGVSKHHFPAQAMPTSAENAFFTYLAAWNESDLAVRIRFSNDGTTWTEWSVLKRDYTSAAAKSSPLHLAATSYRFFEWSVYNKTGEASELSLNFYYPTQSPVHTDALDTYAMTVSRVGCPQPELVDAPTQTRVVSTANEE